MHTPFSNFLFLLATVFLSCEAYPAPGLDAGSAAFTPSASLSVSAAPPSATSTGNVVATPIVPTPSTDSAISTGNVAATSNLESGLVATSPTSLASSPALTSSPTSLASSLTSLTSSPTFLASSPTFLASSPTLTSSLTSSVTSSPTPGVNCTGMFHSIDAVTLKTSCVNLQDVSSAHCADEKSVFQISNGTNNVLACGVLGKDSPCVSGFTFASTSKTWGFCEPAGASGSTKNCSDGTYMSFDSSQKTWRCTYVKPDGAMCADPSQAFSVVDGSAIVYGCVETSDSANSCQPNHSFISKDKNSKFGFCVDPLQQICTAANNMKLNSTSGACSCTEFAKYDQATSKCTCQYGTLIDRCACPPNTYLNQTTQKCSAFANAKCDSNGCTCPNGVSTSNSQACNLSDKDCEALGDVYLDPKTQQCRSFLFADCNNGKCKCANGRSKVQNMCQVSDSDCKSKLGQYWYLATVQDVQVCEPFALATNSTGQFTCTKGADPNKANTCIPDFALLCGTRNCDNCINAAGNGNDVAQLDGGCYRSEFNADGSFVNYFPCTDNTSSIYYYCDQNAANQKTQQEIHFSLILASVGFAIMALPSIGVSIGLVSGGVAVVDATLETASSIIFDYVPAIISDGISIPEVLPLVIDEGSLAAESVSIGGDLSIVSEEGFTWPFGISSGSTISDSVSVASDVSSVFLENGELAARIASSMFWWAA